MGLRRWINFARYSTRYNCIGKGRIQDCKIAVDNSLYIDMTLDGVRFVGNLENITLIEEEE